MTLGLALGACTVGSGSGSAPAEQRAQTLTVLAAASLHDPFTQIAARFEDDHPEVTVRVSFAGSNTLVDQLVAGAPADVLATADTTTMDRAIESRVAYDPVLFASNAPAVVVPADNPAGVTRFSDLADPEVRAVVCAPEVPCGATTVRLEEATDVVIHRVSEEASVTDVLAKVIAGEADAGVVYATDVVAAGSAVREIPTPEAASVRTKYPIAVTADAADHALAGEFVAAVTGDHGRRTLAAAGFGAP